MSHWRLAILIKQSVQFPGDVVVCVHDSSNNVEDEEEQENQPVCGIVSSVVSLSVRLNENGQGNDPCYLCHC